MTTPQLKQQLIEKISGSNDVGLLKQLWAILEDHDSINRDEQSEKGYESISKEDDNFLRRISD